MATETLHIETLVNGSVTVATIDRQSKRNSVDLETLQHLCVALRNVAEQPESRVVVLRGAGGHFSAGADLSGVHSAEFRSVLATALQSLARLPIVTIAHVEGSCLGAGLQLATACDLRIATDDAVFGIPAAKLGLAVDDLTVERLVDLVDGGLARSILLAAELVSLQTALDRGLVNRKGTYDDAIVWAESIAQLAPLSQAAHKAAFANRVTRGPDFGEVRIAADRAWASKDLEEGRTAFAERRPPRFTGH